MNTTNVALNVQIRRIESDLAELFFNPREVDLRVGETLTLRERESSRSVIVQIIAFRSASYPALAREQMESLIDLPFAEEEALKIQMQIGPNDPQFVDELGNIKLALAKIRKTVPAHDNGHARWENWDGWIPARDVEVIRTDDDEVFANATRSLGHDLRLGRTLTGEDFYIEGQDLEKVNVITGVKGSGKCVASGTLILTHQGLKPIESLCPDWKMGWNFLTEKVWVQTPNGHQAVENFYAGGEQATVRLLTRHGFTLEGTPEHPIWCRDPGGSAKWKKLGELTLEDYVAVQRHAPLFGADTDLSGFVPPELHPNSRTSSPRLPKQLDEEIGYLLGVLVGDGAVGYPHPSGRIDLINTDPEILEIFQNWGGRIDLSVSA
ncbi:MAG TPA: hypothetical protein VFR47_06610, partial [Anaerolineales bacterium]|nr:hypothetical protein [Anaerolineales bacterium]